MNWRNSKLIATIRILLGLMMVLMGAMGLYCNVAACEIPGATPEVMTVIQALQVTGWIYVVKLVEIVAGLMLLFNFKPAFANLLLAPLTVAILSYEFILYLHSPGAWIPALLLLVFNVYLGYAYWPKYAPLFKK